MNVRFESRRPWAVAFSYGRAIQEPALEIWHGDQDHTQSAQAALYHRTICNRAARLGLYNEALESDGPKHIVPGLSVLSHAAVA